MEDAPLLEEMAEEDEELDLYNEMTFGLGKVRRRPDWGVTTGTWGVRREGVARKVVPSRSRAGGREGLASVCPQCALLLPSRP